jgi:hypothetical protein
MRAGGLGGGPCQKSEVQAKAFFRFVGWFSHQAANASRWAAIILHIYRCKEQIMTTIEQGDHEHAESARIQRRLQMRMNDLKYCQQYLAQNADKLSRNAQLIRTAVVMLGGFVALKAGAEQLMITYNWPSSVLMGLDWLMFLAGAAISLLTIFEGLRKYSEKGAALRQLSQRSFSLTRVYMSKIDNAKETLRQLNAIDNDMNNQLEQLYKDAEKQGIDLSLDNPVDYAIL